MPEITVLAAYAGAAALLAGPARRSPWATPATVALVLALAAMAGHGWLLFDATLSAGHGSLSLINSVSLTGWMLAAMALAFVGEASWRSLIAFFLAVAGLATLLTSPQTVQDGGDLPMWQFLSHVLLATLAWSLFAAAAALALLSAAKDRYLRAAGLTGWAGSLPPLQSMEKLMFGTIAAGFALLSLAIFSGLIFVDNLLAQHLAHKTVLTVLAWLLFAVLLFGRWRLGWRGRKAINWTLAGFALLVLAYFGSRIVLEVFLRQALGLMDSSTGWLLAALVVLLILSAFFSGTETALMSINRYRLRHRARAGDKGAQLTEKLLERPDRLIGLILLGNNLVNFSASALTTLIAARIGGAAVAISVLLFTLIVLIFAELAPKTLATLRPSRIALPAAYIYYPLLKITYPLVWCVNGVANGLLRLLGVSAGDGSIHSLSSEELRTVLSEAAALVPRRHRRMLVAILDLEQATVEDIMIPRQDIAGIDLSEDWSVIAERLNNSAHTRLPLFDESLDNIVGMLHLRKVVAVLGARELDAQVLRSLADELYFVPEGTSLNQQLLNFQAYGERVALVVDEYGDIQGLITLEDILEEIVGEFTSDSGADLLSDVTQDEDGSYLVTGSANVRVLNRTMRWALPTNGPKTINGLITELLEDIPEPGTRLKLGSYTVEIVHTGDNAVKTVRLRPAS